MDRAKALFDTRTAAGRAINSLGYEVIVMAGIKLACTIGALTGRSALPRSFVRFLFQTSRREIPSSRKTYNVDDFCKDFLPITTSRAKTDMWFDELKYNVLPAALSAMDVTLAPLMNNRQVAEAVVGFALARRGLNESTHFEYCLRRYESESFGLQCHSNIERIPDILKKMLHDGVDRNKFQRAVECTNAVLGVPPRTGYLIPPIELETADVPNAMPARLAAFAVEIVKRVNELGVKSFHDVHLALPHILALPIKTFQFYQISRLVQQLEATLPKSPEQYPLCAGPGMIPLSLGISTSHAVGQTMRGEDVEQALDEDSSDSEAEPAAGRRPKLPEKSGTQYDEMLDRMSLRNNYPATAHHMAVIMCNLLTQVLKESEFLTQCSKLCHCDLAMLLDCDLMGYAICEHRRLLTKRKRRRAGRRLPKSVFCRSHRKAVMSSRHSIIKHYLKKYGLERTRKRMPCSSAGVP